MIKEGGAFRASGQSPRGKYGQSLLSPIPGWSDTLSQKHFSFFHELDIQLMLVLLHGKLCTASGNWLLDWWFFPRSYYSQSSCLMELWDRMDEPFIGNAKQEAISAAVISRQGVRATVVSSWEYYSQVPPPRLCHLPQPLEVSKARSWFTRHQHMISPASSPCTMARNWGLALWMSPNCIAFKISCNTAMPFGSGKPHGLRTWFSGLLACVQGCSAPRHGTRQV